tara:strand:- start:571 stop:972 length:402 start_codon:yes stop_codon:yes gene_type:complete
MSISMQTPTTIHKSRQDEITQTELILFNLRKEQAEVTPQIALIVQRLGADTLDLWNKGFLQNKDIAEIVVVSNLSDGEKILFLHLLVQDSDLENGITAYTSILKNQKRKMKEFSKRAQLKEALRDYLGSDNLG